MNDDTIDKYGIVKNRHNKGVVSHIHESMLIEEPISIILEGSTKDLSLEDAEDLLDGLQAAIEIVRNNQSKLFGDGVNYNLAIIGNTRTGMSYPRSKLGDGETIRIPGTTIRQQEIERTE
jgi:hypothetical protein